MEIRDAAKRGLEFIAVSELAKALQTLQAGVGLLHSAMLLADAGTLQLPSEVAK
jgi:hypothetical protein